MIFGNFVIVISIYVYGGVWGLVLKFPCIVQIYAWFFMHRRNNQCESHANHVITRILKWILQSNSDPNL